MNLFAAMSAFSPLLLVGLLSATPVVVEEYDDEGDVRRHVFLISARTSPAEVLVVRCTRWENGVKVLVLDEIRGHLPGTSTCCIALVELAPNHWQLSESPVEQHLQGLTLVKRERTPSGVLIELRPASDGRAAKRSYRFEWEARLMPWSELARRYPDLPPHPAGAGWVQRRLVYPELPWE